MSIQPISAVVSQNLNGYEHALIGGASAVSATIAEYELATTLQTTPSHQQPLVSDADSLKEDGAALVRDVQAFINRFLVLPDAALLPVTLWCIATYFFDQFDAFPYLAVLSPLPRCGKTRLTEVIEVVAANPRRTVNISEAALFRLIDTSAPTLILDEAEALSGKTERAETVRALLNAGNRRGTQIPRCAGRGELRYFSVYCPKLICGIGVCPDTIRDRSIVLLMQRRKPDEKVERFHHRLVAKEAGAIQERIRVFVDHYRDEIVRLYDNLELPFLEDRDEEAWQPLFALLAVADTSRLGELRSAAVALTHKKAEVGTDEVLVLRLLSDMRKVFGTRTAISTEEILSALRKIDESPWSELTSRKLASMLRPFHVTPRQVWCDGKNVRGYSVADLQDTFERYLGK